ncbi:bifunctional folylpolyglutamate synthase/dihydrofolate synthase [Larkinella soli]|uniref:bifunctional folylpolyglutamate synthase/dihydrofolate synthase n=1 Tax=Larkinella soli TaxID=1770527 RepID=UPI000FFCBEF5|nr:folylpolyglutamate synthase/dihydrofolate synthase family protein [Larkinella soli]
MTYSEAIGYLYAQLPVFHRVGAKALKPGLENTIRLCEYLGNPQEKFKTIHVGGTNGKGSSSHLLAAVLQSAGYRTGLYTSPHLKSFTERIRIDGFPIPEEEVADFVGQHKAFIEDLSPSFFEVTVGLAFDYFARQKVDIAIIEVGLGGRLDSTNVISPILSLITNIGWDHSDILGDSLEKIAYEKAGIIKAETPVVISERNPEVDFVFLEKAKDCDAPIRFGPDALEVADGGLTSEGRILRVTTREGKSSDLTIGLLGEYQLKNVGGVLTALKMLEKSGLPISDAAVENGFKNVVRLTGLKGRWQILQHHPTVICDTAHNEPGLRSIFQSLTKQQFKNLHIITGFVKDKDLTRVLVLFPFNATYYFCEPTIPRALPSGELAGLFNQNGIFGKVYSDVNEALSEAKRLAGPEDIILITGSTYVIAEINHL